MRSIQDCVGYIGGFGWRRLMEVRHRLQHLSRRDHRYASLPAGRNNLFLRNGNIFEAHFQREVAASDHYAIAFLDNAFDVLERVFSLDFSDHWYLDSAFGQVLLQITDIGSRLNKR